MKVWLGCIHKILDCIVGESFALSNTFDPAFFGVFGLHLK